MNPLPFAIDLSQQASHSESEGKFFPICARAPIALNSRSVAKILGDRGDFKVFNSKMRVVVVRIYAVIMRPKSSTRYLLHKIIEHGLGKVVE